MITLEQGIALECACDLAAELLEPHQEAPCCCQHLGRDAAEILQRYPENSLETMRTLRNSTEGRPCRCCMRTCKFTRAALMRYEYELSMAQIEEILGS